MSDIQELIHKTSMDCIEKGQRMERERIIKLLEAHGQTTKSVAGFLGVCCCGQAIDDYQEHLIALIKGEN